LALGTSSQSKVTPTFTVRPEQFRDFIIALEAVTGAHAQEALAWASVMIMLDKRRQAAFEVLLTRDAAISFVGEMRAIVGSDSAVAQWILDSFLAGP
jgi:hypothetical protein